MIRIDGQSFDRLTVEAKRPRGGDESTFAVYGWGTYEESSVLAGQPKKVWLDEFSTLQEAQQKFPQAVLSHPWLEPKVSLDHLPGPDDPVPGGMYPDDWPDEKP